jgi:hypothetical protein
MDLVNAWQPEQYVIAHCDIVAIKQSLVKTGVLTAVDSCLKATKLGT